MDVQVLDNLRQVLDCPEHGRARSRVIVHTADNSDPRIPRQIAEQVLGHHAAADYEHSALLGLDGTQHRTTDGAPSRNGGDCESKATTIVTGSNVAWRWKDPKR